MVHCPFMWHVNSVLIQPLWQHCCTTTDQSSIAKETMDLPRCIWLPPELKSAMFDLDLFVSMRISRYFKSQFLTLRLLLILLISLLRWGWLKSFWIMVATKPQRLKISTFPLISWTRIESKPRAFLNWPVRRGNPAAVLDLNHETAVPPLLRPSMIWTLLSLKAVMTTMLLHQSKSLPDRIFGTPL